MVGTVEINSMSLYILSNYEKGRLSVSRPIFLKEKKRLRTSIGVMSMILCGLEGNNCPIEKINEFIDNNRGKNFPDHFSRYEVIVSADYSEKQRDVLGLMQRLLYKMQSILSKFLLGKSERQELFYLLHAFHNLPRALLSCSSKLYESSDDVLGYADEWLAEIYRHSADHGGTL